MAFVEVTTRRNGTALASRHHDRHFLINNRSIRFSRLLQTRSTVAHVPSNRIVVTESGILATSDVARMQNNGVHAFLVGEALMRAPDPGAELARLFA